MLKQMGQWDGITFKEGDFIKVETEKDYFVGRFLGFTRIWKKRYLMMNHTSNANHEIRKISFGDLRRVEVLRGGV